MRERLAPGAPEALAIGCLCTHMDNFNGSGLGPRFC